MPKRKAALVLLLITISCLSACKKSSESEQPNFFGSPPQLSEVSITKESVHFQCELDTVELCECCCVADRTNTVTMDMDRIKVSAVVSDADGDGNILVVLARFFDPPTSTGTNEISLEMFDTGSAILGTQTINSVTYGIISGDATAGDHRFTRFFYMKSVVLADVGDCVLSTDTTNFGGTFSQFSLTDTFPATKILNFTYHVEAVDRAGNITPSASTTLGVIEAEGAAQTVTEQCGPPNGTGGCAPPP